MSFLWSLNGYSQKTYFRLGSSYSIQTPNAWTMTRASEANSTSISYESVKCKLGSGFKPQITLGYCLNPYASFEINGGYHFGATQTVENEIYDSGINYTQSTEYSIENGFINPNFVINPNFKKLNPYLGLGVFVGFSNQMTEKITNSNDDYLRRYTSSGGSQFGFAGKFGLAYVLNSKWQLYSELSFVNASWTPNKKHLNAAFDNAGKDIYDAIKPHEVLTDYVEDYKHGNPGLPDLSKPQKKSKFSIPMDCVSVGIGVSYLF